jgi:hypothetical protein
MSKNPDNFDHLRATPGDPAPTAAPPAAASEVVPETASDAASEISRNQARMIRESWDQGPPWASVEHLQRGRRSAAALGVVPVDVRRTPSPPPERLTAAEKELWAELIASRRANWFAGSEAILECYCTTRHPAPPS